MGGVVLDGARGAEIESPVCCRPPVCLREDCWRERLIAFGVKRRELFMRVGGGEP